MGRFSSRYGILLSARPPADGVITQQQAAGASKEGADVLDAAGSLERGFDARRKVALKSVSATAYK